MNRTSRLRAALHRVLPRVLVAAAGAVAAARPVFEADPYFHMALGREVLRHHSRVVPEPLAFDTWSDPVVVPEWLWSVAAYAMHVAFGPVGVSLLAMIGGALCGYFLARVVERVDADHSAPLRWALAMIALSGIASKLVTRPQSLSYAILAAFIASSYHFAASHRGPGRRSAVIALMATMLIWTQAHGSFVLGPVIFAAIALPRLRHEPEPREAMGRTGVALIGILGACLCSAYGVQIVPYILSHSGGDAVSHVYEMQPFDLGMLRPFGDPRHAPLFVLVVLALLGMWAGRVLLLSELLLLGLGFALARNADRFLAEATVLALPAATLGLRQLTASAARAAIPPPPAQNGLARGLALGLPCALYAASVISQQDRIGPLFELGLRQGREPVAAARYLRRMPRGTPVLTEYITGPPLGFWLDGRIRTFIDGRTPLHFDSTDMAVQRDVSDRRGAMAAAVERYKVEAVVWPRNEPGCANVPPGFRPVVIEARHTTFVRDGQDPPLVGLNPCGATYLSDDACRDGGRELKRSIERMRHLHDSPFIGFLRASAAMHCGSFSPKEAMQQLGDAKDASEYLQQYQVVRAWGLLATGQQHEAVALLRALVTGDNPLAVHVLTLPAAGEVSLADARSILKPALQTLGRSAPSGLRLRLATICQRTHDLECVRYQALRAALQGDPRASPYLAWLAAHAETPRLRRDMQAWLDTFTKLSDRVARAAPAPAPTEPTPLRASSETSAP